MKFRMCVRLCFTTRCVHARRRLAEFRQNSYTVRGAFRLDDDDQVWSSTDPPSMDAVIAGVFFFYAYLSEQSALFRIVYTTFIFCTVISRRVQIYQTRVRDRNECRRCSMFAIHNKSLWQRVIRYNSDSSFVVSSRLVVSSSTSCWRQLRVIARRKSWQNCFITSGEKLNLLIEKSEKNFRNSGEYVVSAMYKI